MATLVLPCDGSTTMLIPNLIQSNHERELAHSQAVNLLFYTLVCYCHDNEVTGFRIKEGKYDTLIPIYRGTIKLVNLNH